MVLKYPGMVGTLIVDVAARYAVRNLVINLEKVRYNGNGTMHVLILRGRE